MVFPLRFPLKGLIPHTLSEEDRLAAEAILAEALAAKKRADQFGVLSYLKREPSRRSKVPNTGFLKNVLNHTVGSNRTQKRTDEYDRHRKDRKRKRSSPERRNSAHRQALELDEQNSKHTQEHNRNPAIGPTREQFVSRRGRGTFAFSGEGCTIDELFKDEDSIPDLRVPQPLPEEQEEEEEEEGEEGGDGEAFIQTSPQQTVPSHSSGEVGGEGKKAISSFAEERERKKKKGKKGKKAKKQHRKHKDHKHKKKKKRQRLE